MLATQHDICGCCRATPVYDFCVLVFDPSYPGLVLSVRDVEFSSGCRCPELNLFGFKILGWTPEREAPGNRRRHTRIGFTRGGRRKRLKKSERMGGESRGRVCVDEGVPQNERPRSRNHRKAGSKSNTAAAGNLIQFGERKKLKNRSRKLRNHNYL